MSKLIFTPSNVIIGIILICLAFFVWPALHYIYPAIWGAFIGIGVLISMRSTHSGNFGAVLWLTTLEYLSIPAAVGLIYFLIQHIRFV